MIEDWRIRGVGGESGVKVPWSWDDEDWKILGIGMVADFEDPRI